MRVRSDGSSVDIANVEMNMSPFDEIAVDEAVRLREKGAATEVIAVPCGVAQCQETPRSAMVIEADRAILPESGVEALGIKAATEGPVIAHCEKVNMTPEKGTGWHHHEAQFQIVYMTKGSAGFICREKVCLFEVGDCVRRPPGIGHLLFDDPPDQANLEIVGSADFKSIEVPAPCDVPPSTPWGCVRLPCGPAPRAHLSPTSPRSRSSNDTV